MSDAKPDDGPQAEPSDVPSPEELAAIMASVDETLEEARKAVDVRPDASAVGTGINARMAAYHAAGALLNLGVPPSFVARLEHVALEVAGGISDMIDDRRDTTE
ncbi:hypothetical protein [Paludisphaera rhizosphaerae]|uniref:hypothetical protein n=1 Tax=Paludisphaera rhizosphaerae TaxID=2711216 RepID=UPI0013EBF2A2|nr:hypothetical protein [Paludisphaera rhizosphaerae]